MIIVSTFGIMCEVELKHSKILISHININDGSTHALKQTKFYENHQNSGSQRKSQRNFEGRLLLIENSVNNIGIFHLSIP
jgi:hypothetical protein